MSEPYVGYFLLALTSNGKANTISLNLTSLSLAPLQSTTLLADKSIQPFAAQLEALKSSRPAPITAVSAKLELASPENLEFLSKTIHKLQQDYVLYIYKIQAEISSR